MHTLATETRVVEIPPRDANVTLVPVPVAPAVGIIPNSRYTSVCIFQQYRCVFVSRDDDQAYTGSPSLPLGSERLPVILLLDS